MKHEYKNVKVRSNVDDGEQKKKPTLGFVLLGMMMVIGIKGAKGTKKEKRKKGKRKASYQSKLLSLLQEVHLAKKDGWRSGTKWSGSPSL